MLVLATKAANQARRKQEAASEGGLKNYGEVKTPLREPLTISWMAPFVLG